MTIKKPGDNSPITQENEPVVNSDPLKGYEWRDGEEIRLKNGSKLFLIKQGKNNFGFSYIDEDGTYHPELSQEGGLTDPESKNSPFMLFGNAIMEAGKELPKENTEENNESDTKKEKEDNKSPLPKKIKITAVIKKIATEKGLTEEDLEKIIGTGKGENITKKDIEEYLNSKEDDLKKKEWRELKKDERVEVLEDANFSIKIGSSFALDGTNYLVTSIKEKSLDEDEADYEISFDLKRDGFPDEKTVLNVDDLEDMAKKLFDSLKGDKKKFKEALYGAPKIIPAKKKNKPEKIIKNKVVENNKEETENSISFDGFTFEVGKTTFQVDGNQLRIEKIIKKGNNKNDWELTVSKINPLNKRAIEQKQKDGRWLSEIITEFASKNKLNLKNTEDKNEAQEIASNDKKPLEKKSSVAKKVIKNEKTNEEKLNPTTEKEANELVNFFANNLNSAFAKIKKPEEQQEKVNRQKEPVLVVKKENQPKETTGESKGEAPESSFVNQEAVYEEKTNEEPEDSELKKIIQRENSKYKKNYDNSLKTTKKEKKENKWRNIKAWALGLLGLGATAYGVKEYSEQETIDKELNLEPRYEYVENKKEQPQIKTEKETKNVEKKKEATNEPKNESVKNKELEETKGIETFKVKEIVRDSILENKNDSLNNIIPEKAPSFLVDVVSMYHPELTSAEKEIIGTSYSKVLEYISGDDDIESFYKNISWLNTMGWEIDSTLEVSKRVLAGEYGEVGETEKRMAEYFINFAKRQEANGIPASGVKTEEYIISGLIKDAGIKKE